MACAPVLGSMSKRGADDFESHVLLNRVSMHYDFFDVVSQGLIPRACLVNPGRNPGARTYTTLQMHHVGSGNDGNRTS